jgi:manganese/zinc/iron transport system permease protein
MSPTLIILLTGSMVATSCALVGSFLVLRRMSMLGDAISHSVLPGIVIAFLLTGSRAPLPMLIGAGLLGVLTVFLVERLQHSRRLYEDASIGVVFPALFALGVILVSRYTGQVDLDLDCVLYGEIAYAPWDRFYWGEVSLGPRSLWINGAVLLLNLALVGGFYKELKLASFDPGLAAALGFPPLRLHYLLMSAVSITVVGSFESVGAILVVAMLIVPAASALLLCDRLATMLLLAVGIGIMAVGAGYTLAWAWDASIAGGMATATGALFLVALMFSPRHGLLARTLRHRRLSLRLSGDLLLLHLRHADRSQSEEEIAARFGWPAAKVARVIQPLRQAGLLEPEGPRLRLTLQGAERLAGNLDAFPSQGVKP